MAEKYTEFYGPYAFSVFSSIKEVKKETLKAIQIFEKTASKFEKTGDRQVLLPSLRLSIKAAKKILSTGLETNAISGSKEPGSSDGQRINKFSELSRILNRCVFISICLEEKKDGKVLNLLSGDVRFGYKSYRDLSDQPFVLYVPKKAPPKGGWPIMVRLHGAWSEMETEGWLLQTFEWDREFNRNCPRGDFLEIYPFGRLNSWYKGAGAQDVFDVISLVEELFPVNKNKKVIMGSSMGGFGVWNIADKFPEEFEKFKAACLVVGALRDEAAAPAQAKIFLKTPVMFITGGKDVPDCRDNPEKYYKWLKARKADTRLVFHPASGHRIETTDYHVQYYRFFAEKLAGIK